MTEVFLTIASITEGLYKSKGSKFISFAIPVHTVDEVKDIISAYRKKYHDARHICYAYVLQPDRSEFRANDDGEPSGTAGRPILGQINSRGLTNIMVVVIRYFGGVLLGTGGLITAYKEAASAALNDTVVVERNVEVFCEIHFQYPLINEVMKLVKESDAIVNEQYFGNECILKCVVPMRMKNILFGKLNKINEVRIIL